MSCCPGNFATPFVALNVAWCDGASGWHPDAVENLGDVRRSKIILVPQLELAHTDHNGVLAESGACGENEPAEYLV